MTVRTYIDKHCDPEARYTAEFYLTDIKVTERSVVSVDISCFAASRSKSKSDLRKTLDCVIIEMQKAIEGLK